MQKKKSKKRTVKSDQNFSKKRTVKSDQNCFGAKKKRTVKSDQKFSKKTQKKKALKSDQNVFRTFCSGPYPPRKYVKFLTVKSDATFF